MSRLLRPRDLCRARARIRALGMPAAGPAATVTQIHAAAVMRHVNAERRVARAFLRPLALRTGEPVMAERQVPERRGHASSSAPMSEREVVEVRRSPRRQLALRSLFAALDLRSLCLDEPPCAGLLQNSVD